jgi:cytochrome c-type biogenesis protein
MSIQASSLLFAFTAGLFSIFSPCSYPLLPGYMSYYLGSEFSVEKAFSGGVAATLGLLTVFTIIGGSASIIGGLLRQLVPVLDMFAAFFLILMGISTLIDINLYLSLPLKPIERQGYTGLYLFGIVYGLAGIGCSAPIFLSILFYSMSKGVLQGSLSFMLYAFGMGIPLVATSIIIAKAKVVILNRVNRAAPILKRLSGIILILVGLLLIYFHYYPSLI